MKKLLALYKVPADSDTFMHQYREAHLPLVNEIPGLIKIELTRIERTLIGDPGNFLLAEMFFADAESLNAAMKSPENAAAAADLTDLAPGIVTVMTGSVLED